MKIDAIEWIKKNKDKITKEEKAELDQYNFFEQLKTGELELPAVDLFKLIGLLGDIMLKHTDAVGGK